MVSGIELGPPRIEDGAQLWRIATAAGGLDVNSSYAYLLWCRDFADTSVLARRDGTPVGYAIGYRRPAAPDTYFLWQVAVAPSARGRGLARRMMDEVLDRLGVRALEATVTQENVASRALFDSIARARGARIGYEPLFLAEHFPDGHAAEELVRIEPLC